MAETLNLNLKGLYLNPNQFSEVPEGALNAADNVVIDRDSVAETRRGQAQYGLLAGIVDKEFIYQGTLLVHYNDKIAYDSNGAGTFTPYSGSFDSPDNALRIHSLEASQNLYLTTNDGIQKLDSLTSQFQDAGGITALGGTYTLSNPGFMSDQTQVAYRLVWGYTDANGNEIVGVPSQRLVIINDSGDTADVVMTWQIPSGISTSYFYRVYRSGESAGVNSAPDDELQQVKEGSPTSSQISAGQFSFTDIVPDALRGAFLYTDPSQEGILQANYPPPFAVDLALFKNVVFYANTRSKQRYFVNLIAVGDNTLGGNFGYQTNNGDTHTNTTIDALTKAASVVIQDLTYTADTAGVAGNDISIEYIGGGTAGAEIVTVLNSAITVQIQSGVSTATQVKTAVDASGPAAALVNITISGVGGNPQVTQAQTFLEDGFDTTYLNVGMRVVGTGVQSGTLIVSIDSSSSITVTPATTATATVALKFEDRFSIDNMNYWAADTADYTNRQFIAVLSGTPGENIEATALNLIAAINHDPNNTTVYAYYQSGAEDLPGKILIEERGIGGNEFILTSTNGESFSPVLSSTGASNVSDNDARQNRIMFSKVQQPEAVPLVNFLDVGSENFPILRILANRDSLFIFKETEGIFRITGTDSSNWDVSLFDSSARIRAPETAVILNNQVFTFSDQGIIAVSENGVQIISRPIEAELLRISSPLFTYFEENAFSISYESDRKYIFFCMDEESEQWPTQAFVYNTITNTFTKWIMNRSSGLVLDSDNKLYLGNPDDLYVYKERKNFDRTDYADNEFEVEITAFDSTAITLDDTTGIEAGDLLKQGGNEAIVEEVVDATDIIVSQEETWDIDTATIFQGIDTNVEWVPNTADNPGILKHYSETTVFFRNADFDTVDLGFQTNFNSNFEEVTLPEPTGAGWGQFQWGLQPWGVGGGRAVAIRTYVPLEMQRASWLNFSVSNREAYSSFALSGVSAQVEPMTSRFR